VPGVTVLGQPISPEPGKDIIVNPGKNTHLSSDGLELISDVDGYLYRDKGFICVGQLYIVKGNVDFHSGDIDYHGDVLIRGSVLPDFKIKAGGSVTIEGDVEAADVIAKAGNVRIRGGIFGKGKAHIQAPKGILETRFCQDCRLEAGRTLKVDKYIRNCSIVTGTLEMKGVGAHICGSDVHFRERISVNKMGTENGGKNTLYYVDENIDGVEEKMHQMEKSLEALNIKVNQEEAEIARLRVQVPRAKAGSGLASRLQEVLTSYKMNKRTQTLLEKRLESLKEQMVRPSTLERLVEMQYLLPLLEVHIFGKVKVFRESLKSLKIEWRNEDISTLSI
jgi:uncharacterized protein (DUF342 family)